MGFKGKRIYDYRVLCIIYTCKVIVYYKLPTGAIEQWCGSLLVSVTLSCVLRLTINTKYQNSICLIHPPILCNSFITYTLLTTTLYNILITFTDVDTYVECFLTFTVVKTTYIYIYVCVLTTKLCINFFFFFYIFSCWQLHYVIYLLP